MRSIAPETETELHITAASHRSVSNQVRKVDANDSESV